MLTLPETEVQSSSPRKLLESFDQSHKAPWHEGLRLIDLMSRHYSGKSFVETNQEQRVAILSVLSNNVHMTDLPEVRFFIELKRLTVRGYYTSKISGFTKSSSTKAIVFCRSLWVDDKFRNRIGMIQSIVPHDCR